jgi:hypothetical protein
MQNSIEQENVKSSNHPTQSDPCSASATTTTIGSERHYGCLDTYGESNEVQVDVTG